MTPRLLAVRALLVAAAAAAAAAPPQLASLAGARIAPDANPRDVPAITNFWGSVGSSPSDVVGLSQVMLPPFLDVGVPTAALRAAPATACAPDAVEREGDSRRAPLPAEASEPGDVYLPGAAEATERDDAPVARTQDIMTL